jgi:hypothetical protein
MQKGDSLSFSTLLGSGGRRLSLLNSLTATGAYMHHRFSWALLELNNFLNFCPFATFDSLKFS